MLKEILKKGETSIADVRSPDYNPDIFINTAKSIKKERANAKLENASICFDKTELGDEENESSAMNTKKNSNLDEDEKLIRQNLRASATSNKQIRNKSTQPQKLRKIADGLISFERYVDRKKRLDSIS